MASDFPQPILSKDYRLKLGPKLLSYFQNVATRHGEGAVREISLVSRYIDATATSCVDLKSLRRLRVELADAGGTALLELRLAVDCWIAATEG